jgi:hypothetical protein
MGDLKKTEGDKAHAIETRPKEEEKAAQDRREHPSTVVDDVRDARGLGQFVESTSQFAVDDQSSSRSLDLGDFQLALLRNPGISIQGDGI